MSNPDPNRLAAKFGAKFARFEFALKANSFIKNTTLGSPAEPGWDEFVRRFEGSYSLTGTGKSLISMNPRRQKVGPNGLEFHDVGFDDQPSELGRVVRLLKTVRNNLLHGGKHTVAGWDNPERTFQLLVLAIAILDELAHLGGIEGHYKPDT